MRNIGYARVSSTDQDFEVQVERLKAVGCERVYREKPRASPPMAGTSLPRRSRCFSRATR